MKKLKNLSSNGSHSFPPQILLVGFKSRHHKNNLFEIEVSGGFSIFQLPEKRYFYSENCVCCQVNFISIPEIFWGLISFFLTEFKAELKILKISWVDSPQRCLIWIKQEDSISDGFIKKTQTPPKNLSDLQRILSTIISNLIF